MHSGAHSGAERAHDYRRSQIQHDGDVELRGGRVGHGDGRRQALLRSSPTWRADASRFPSGKRPVPGSDMAMGGGRHCCTNVSPTAALVCRACYACGVWYAVRAMPAVQGLQRDARACANAIACVLQEWSAHARSEG
jgi:hypothetical protein